MAIKKLRTGVLAGCGLMVAAMSSQTAQAAIVFDSGGFEAYTTGAALDAGGQPGGFTTANSNITGGTVASTITTASPLAGTKSAVVTATNITGGTYGYNTPTVPSVPVGSTVEITYLQQTTIPPSGTNALTGLGITVFNNTADKAVSLSLLEAGDGSPADDKLVYATAQGQLFSTPAGLTGAGAAVGSVNAYDVILNYTAGTFAISRSVGNTGTFVPVAAGALNTNGGFYDVAITAQYVDADTSLVGSGSGKFDSFLVTAVPEPTTASVILGGLAFAGLRRRRPAAK
jgi:hypothetical protein